MCKKVCPDCPERKPFSDLKWMRLGENQKCVSCREAGRGGEEIDAEVAVCLLILPVVVLDVMKQALPSSADG